MRRGGSRSSLDAMFGPVSARERRDADRFLAELMGERPTRRARGRWSESEPVESASDFPTLLEVWNRDRLQLVFFFRPITTSFKNATGTYSGRFWVTSDAVKWKIPASEGALLSLWNRWKQPDPIDQDGDMLCRLPCSAKQCQELADRITTHPDPVRTRAEDGLVNHTIPARSDMQPQPCLLLTPYLYSQRYQHMSCKVAPVGRDSNAPIIPEAAKHNQYLNQQIAACMRRSNTSLAVPSLGDPGKIWAITNKLYVSRAANGRPSAINYGWHGPGATLNAVIPGLKCLQSVGTRHDDVHRDYSQVCVLVSGWCEVTEPGETTPKWMRTEEVYTTPRLCRLVTEDGAALTRVRYDT